MRNIITVFIAAIGFGTLGVVGAGCTRVASSGWNGSTTGPDLLVRKVDIKGNKAVEDKPIVEGLATRPPEGILFRTIYPYDPLALRVDVDRIIYYYKTQGYFSAKVTDTAVRNLDRKNVAVRFVVDEGEPAHISAVRIQGLPAHMRQREVLESINGSIKKGKVFDYEAYELAKDNLRRWFLEHGHAYAEVEGVVAVDRDENSARVTFQVDPGPRVRFGRTTIQGLRNVPESAVRNRIAWNPGEHFDPVKLEMTQARLYELDLFGFVRIDYERAEGAQDIANLLIRVSEVEASTVRLGGGIGMDPSFWELRARASYTLRSALDPLLILRLDARPGYALRRSEGGQEGFGGQARLTAERTDIMFPRLLWVGTASYDQTDIDIYRSRGPSGRIELRRPFAGDRLHLGVGWELNYLFFDRVASPVQALASELHLEDPYRNAFFDQSIRYDRRDSFLDATRGVYAELRLEEGGSYAGGRFSYVRSTGELRGYQPLASPQLVLAGRVRYGRSLYNGMPITRRFFSGGSTNHRGFAQRHLSPEVTGPADEDEMMTPIEGEAPIMGRYRIGGSELLETSAELRWDFMRLWDNWLGVVGFADGGDVPLEVGGLDLTNLHWAVGGGLRYETPVGPVRADVGIRVTRVNEPPAETDRWAFHLSLGEAF